MGRTTNNQQRPSLDEYFIRMAYLVASRATCKRRSVGCVLVDEHGHVLSTGYNGRPSGMTHCNHQTYKLHTDGRRKPTYPHACPGANEPSGTSLGMCEAVHAEQNALLQCHDPFAIQTCYCTTLPCKDTCIKMLMNTSCSTIVFAESYQNESEIIDFWLRSGTLTRKREIYKHPRV